MRYQPSCFPADRPRLQSPSGRVDACSRFRLIGRPADGHRKSRQPVRPRTTYRRPFLGGRWSTNIARLVIASTMARALYDAPALPPAQAGRPGPARRMPCLRRLLGSGARHQQALVAGEEGLARSRARWRQLRFSREYMLPSPIPLDDRCRARARVQARSSGSAAVQRRDERDAVARLEHIVELVLKLPVGWTGSGAVGVSVKSDEWTRRPKRTVVDEDEDAGSTAGDGEEGGVAVSGSSNARLADHGHGTHTVSPSRKSSSRSRRRCLAR